MWNLLALLLLTLSIFLFAVGIYSYIAKISVAEARDRVVNFIKETFALQPQEPTFQVFIGLDEGVPNALIIEKEFAELEDIFTSYYYANIYSESNVLCYVFTVGLPKKEIEQKELEKYVQGVCESLVHSYLHKYNPYVGKIQNLVVTELNESILRVYIATTPTATELLARKKANMQLNSSKEKAEATQIRSGTIEV